MSVNDILPNIRYLTTFQDTTRPRLARFRNTFLVGASIVFLILLYSGFSRDPLTGAGAAIIVITGLAPAWLWVNGKVQGLPIYPFYSLTFIWAYAIPLVTDHPIVALFPPTYHLWGALTISLCNGAGTIAWYAIAKRKAVAPAFARVLPMSQGRFLFWSFLVAALVFNLFSYTGAFTNETQGFSTVRGFALGIASIAGFYFGYQHGVGTLNPFQKAAYMTLIAASGIVSMTGLLLAYAATTVLTCIMGYVLGRGTFPWVTGGVIVAFFLFFHAGKSNQREQHWAEQAWKTVNLDEYPGFFWDWLNHSVSEIKESVGTSTVTKEESNRNLFERMSLMHLFLYFQYTTGEQVPYLWGLTYTAIPELLIPRILLKEKVYSHFGNNVLAVHYGIIPNDSDTQTSVGFGFINEGYANFGLYGALGVSILVGLVYGWIGHMTAAVPIMSYRFLFGVIVQGMAIQNEHTLGVVVSSTFQATVAFTLVSSIFMRPFPLAKANELIRQVIGDIKLARGEAK